MGGNYTRIHTRNTGNTISGPDDDSEFDNIIANSTPAGLDDASVNDAAMQSTADPFPGSAISKPTSLTGELERLRFLIKQQEVTSQWYIYPDLVSKSATYTATQDDKVILGDASGGNFTITLPTAVGILNKVFFIKNTAATGTVTVDGNGSETIDGATTKALASQFEFIGIVSDNANWQTITGLSANAVTLTGTQTLTNKTLTTPTIADLTNMAHDHADDAGGGLLSATEGGAVALRVVEVGIAVSTDTWTKFAECEVWIPAGVTTLSVRTRAKISSASTLEVRMVIQASSTNGTGSSVATSSTYLDHDNSIDPNVTDKGDWAIIEFQCKANNAATITMHKDEETISGKQRNYTGASYWT